MENAIYVIRNKNRDKNLELENNTPVFVNNPKKNLKKHFRIFAIDKDTKKQTYDINPNNLYCIEDKDQHKRIGIINDKGDIGLIPAPNDRKDFNNNSILWIITPKIFEEKEEGKTYKKVYYYIKSVKTGKYLIYKESNGKGKFVSETDNIDKFTNNNYFNFYKMYREPHPKENLERLEKEPIDVFFKYIDLTDPNLKREGIKQITKDQDNQELKYSVRAVLKNIPWIRKIFILMPNERVRYFKPPEEIKDKIVYVKDKDLLGFDSASVYVFHFHLWKMKQFGMSENFILLDDDYFVGKPLKKSNFFYEENGEVYPALVTSDYYELSKSNLEQAFKPLLKNIKTTSSHSPNGFHISQKLSLLLLYDIFGLDNSRYGLPLIEPSFTHNAIPMKQSDIKEIYDDIVKYYKYRDETLKAKIRDVMSLQSQTLYMGYTRNKYDRRVKMISSLFYDLTQFKGVINSHLFVINVSDRNYAKSYFQNEIKYLEKLFPDKTPYELDGSEQSKKDDNKKKEEEKKDKTDKVKTEKDKTDKEKTDKDKTDKDKNIKVVDDQSDYKKLMDYLETKFNEKKQQKNDILSIKNGLNELNEKFDKMNKEVETLLEKMNETIMKNITLIENSDSKISWNTKLIYIIIIFLIVTGILYYLIKNGYFKVKDNNDTNEVNYYDINSLNNSTDRKEMSLINSKIDILL